MNETPKPVSSAALGVRKASKCITLADVSHRYPNSVSGCVCVSICGSGDAFYAFAFSLIFDLFGSVQMRAVVRLQVSCDVFGGTVVHNSIDPNRNEEKQNAYKYTQYRLDSTLSPLNGFTYLYVMPHHWHRIDIILFKWSSGLSVSADCSAAHRHITQT